MFASSFQIMNSKRSLYILLAVTGIYYLSSESRKRDHSQQFEIGTITEGDGIAYRERLRQIANKDKVLILALIDFGFVDVAINFWETSIKPLGIKNMLFVSVSRKACEVLASLGMPCHIYKDFTGGEHDSTYLSPVYLEKMNIRTRFILEALFWNFTVLNTDTDVIFFKNPLNYFRCKACNIEILEDTPGILNAGFLYLRPSNVTGM